MDRGCPPVPRGESQSGRHPEEPRLDGVQRFDVPAQPELLRPTPPPRPRATGAQRPRRPPSVPARLPQSDTAPTPPPPDEAGRVSSTWSAVGSSVRTVQNLRRQHVQWPPPGMALPGTSGAGWKPPTSGSGASWNPLPLQPVLPRAPRPAHQRSRWTQSHSLGALPSASQGSQQISQTSGQRFQRAQLVEQPEPEPPIPAPAAQEGQGRCKEEEAAKRQAAVSALQKFFFDEMARGGSPNGAAARALLRLNGESPAQAAVAPDSADTAAAGSESAPASEGGPEAVTPVPPPGLPSRPPRAFATPRSARCDVTPRAIRVSD